MPIWTFEGIVESGQIRFRDNVTPPEKTRAYVVIPDLEAASPKARVCSPRLVHPEQVSDFAKRAIKGTADARL